MTDNVASLGFEVNSKPLDDAKKSLGEVSTEAAKTGKAVEDFNQKVGKTSGEASKANDSIGKISPSLQTLQAAAKAAGVSVEEMRSRTAAFNAESAKLAASAKTTATAISTIAKEAASVAPALNAVGAASATVAKEHEAHSSSLAGLRNNLRGMSPLLNQFGGGLGDILQYSKAARLGLEGLAVVAGGALLVALAKVSDETERTKRNFAALTGSQEQGSRTFNAVEAAAKSAGLELGTVASAVNTAALGFDKLSDRNVIYANTGDRLTKFTEGLSEAFGKLGASMQSNGATAETETKILNTLAESIKSTGGLTVETFAKIRGESALAARAISDAFNYKDIEEFQKQLAKTPITAQQLIDALKRIEEAKDPVNSVDKSIRELNKAWDDFVKTLSETGAVGLVKDTLKGLSGGIKEISDNLPNLKSQFDSSANSVKSWGDIIKVVEDKNSLFGKSIDVDIGAAITKYIDFMSQGAQAAFDFEKSIASAMGGALSAVGNFAVSAGQQLASFANSAIQAASQAASAMASIGRGGSGGASASSTDALGNVMGGDGGVDSSVGLSSGAVDYAQQVADGSLPAFATGGQFTVGGDGGTDTTKVSFLATKGEVVTVSTPNQAATSQSSTVLTPTQDQSAVGVVSATPDEASLATVKEITDAIDKSTIDITKKVLEGSDNIVSALNKLIGGVASTTVNPATGLPLAGGTSINNLSRALGLGAGGGASFTVNGLNDNNGANHAAFEKLMKDQAAQNKAAGGPPTGYDGGIVTSGRRGDGSSFAREPRRDARPSPPLSSSQFPLRAAINPSYSTGYSGYTPLDSNLFDYLGGYDGYSSDYGSIGQQQYDSFDYGGSNPFSGSGFGQTYDYGGGYQTYNGVGDSYNDTGLGNLSYDTSANNSSGFSDYDPNKNNYGYFATGGKFTVGGDGGIDTTPIFFHATKGETVEITPAGVASPVSATPPAASDPSQANAASSTMTKNVIIQVQAGIQAQDFIRSRAQIARGI